MTPAVLLSSSFAQEQYITLPAHQLVSMPGTYMLQVSVVCGQQYRQYGSPQGSTAHGLNCRLSLSLCVCVLLPLSSPLSFPCSSTAPAPAVTTTTPTTTDHQRVWVPSVLPLCRHHSRDNTRQRRRQGGHQTDRRGLLPRHTRTGVQHVSVPCCAVVVVCKTHTELRKLPPPHTHLCVLADSGPPACRLFPGSLCV